MKGNYGGDPADSVFPPYDGSRPSETDGLISEPPSRPKMFHTMSLSLLILVPWVMFTLNMVLWTFCIHNLSLLVYTSIALCIGVCALFSAVRGRRPAYFYLMLGMLGFLAIGTGCAVGELNNLTNMTRYWEYEGQRDYTNVDPTESALTHLDAGTIEFAAGTWLDLEHSVGYHSGSFYCVAPVLGSQRYSVANIQYMAAGVDCCGQRGSFTCNDSGDHTVVSGLVYLESDPNVAEFRKAAEQAAAVWGMQVSQDALFLQWVRDPDSAQRGYRRQAILFAIMTSGIALVTFVVIGFSLHFSTGRRTSKPGQRY
mmetsp:Transcript_66331/g.158695  ORF Transcript_66331/g.158695 Transcript_66331/m.158695 type:complete len:312 (+) Transcript_66331:148-1083(+)